MFEEDKNDKIYNLIISKGTDKNNEHDQFVEKLYSKVEFLWTESFSSKYSQLSESFFDKIDVIIILAGLYEDNKESIDELCEVGEKYEIPIVLVRPYGLEEVPENLEKKATGLVGWNVNCIIESIKGAVSGDYDLE